MALSDNMRGILLMLLAMGSFAINDGFIKGVSGQLNIGQVLLIRGGFTIVLIWTLARYLGQLAPLKTAFRPLLVWRSLFEIGATLTFINALFNLPFANVSAILQALPLVVTLGAAVFFGDVFGWRRLMAILVGLAGVLLIIRPGTDQFSIYSLSCVGTVICAAARDLISTRLDRTIPSLFVSLQTAVVVTGAGAMLCLFGTWEPVSARHVGLLAMASIFLAMAYFGIVSTMRVGVIAIIAPFRYSILLFSIVIGMVAFSEFPDRVTWLGSGIIVATGIYTIYREHLSKS